MRQGAQQREPSEEPSLLGRYELTSLLARGKLSRIHAAQEIEAIEPRPYAIKRLRARYREHPAWRRALLSTGEMAARLQCDHLVRVVAVHEQPEPFLVMERVAGISLETFLTRAPSEERARCALPMILDLLAGLHAMHTACNDGGQSAGWVHGAPCARHVIVGVDGVARLIDYTHATGDGLPFGSAEAWRMDPAEMAPEQALAPAHVDPRCDVFIVGSVLFHVLTGRRLFAHGSRADALSGLLRGAVSLPKTSEYGPGLNDVCLRALQKSRRARFPSAAAFADALREAVERAASLATRSEIAAVAEAIETAPDQSVLTDRRERKATTEAIEAESERPTWPGIGASPAEPPTRPSTRAAFDAADSYAAGRDRASISPRADLSPAHPLGARALQLCVVLGLASLGAAVVDAALDARARLANESQLTSDGVSRPPVEAASSTRLPSNPPRASLVQPVFDESELALERRTAQEAVERNRPRKSPSRPTTSKGGARPLARPERPVRLREEETVRSVDQEPGAAQRELPAADNLPQNPYE